MFLATITQVTSLYPGAHIISCNAQHYERGPFRVVRSNPEFRCTEILSDPCAGPYLAWINAAERIERQLPAVQDVR